MTRRRNAPLKGARPIGSNMTEVEHGDLTILYSYETPVAFLSSNGGYITDKFWSNTTSKHISKFFAHHGYDKKGAFKIPQEDVELFVRAGKVGPQSMIREENPAGQLWYPGGVGIGQDPQGEYMAVPLESTVGWDVVTLRSLFPEDFDAMKLGVFEARLGYEHSGQQGFHLFKVRVEGKWSRPFRLRERFIEAPWLA